MENQNEPDFTFGSDEGKTSYSNDADNKKIEKLTQKVTLLSILIPCILGLLVVFLYFDISNKVGQVDSSGSAKVQNISKELEKTISGLKTQSDALEKKLLSRIDSIDKTLAGINKKMNKAEKNISFLTYAKANKKQTAADLGKLNTATAEIKADIKAVANSNAQLVVIAEKLKAKTDEIDAVKTSLKLLRSDIEKTNGAYVSKKELENSLKKQKRLFQLEINDTYNKLTKKIALLKFANQADSKKTDVVEPNIN